MTAALTGIEICVFDAYGTLFDFNSAVARHRAAIGPKADALVGDVAQPSRSSTPGCATAWAPTPSSGR